MKTRSPVWLWLGLFLVACASEAGAPEDVWEPGPAELSGADVEAPPPVDPGHRLRAEGWLAGDLHMHSTHSDGDDPVAIVVALAEYFTDPVFLAAHPEYEGNPLDFIALTDHRTVVHNSDPDYRSDYLVLIRGDEYGGPGHACIWGLEEHIPHGNTHESYREGVAAAHAQGALFSINHPFTEGITFPWDVREHDALEVVNARWALMGPAIEPEFLEAWEASNGPASPFFRKATQYTGTGGNQQALVFYEAMLSRGVHVALVGGSDRHMLFTMGFPTTWVHATASDEAGVLEGIRRRHTFVSRSPVSATVELSGTTRGGAFVMGDHMPVPEPEEIALTLRVGRAPGGLLRIVRGGYVESDEALAEASLGEVVYEQPIEGADETFEITLEVAPGDWLYPLVLEPLVAPGLSAEQATAVVAMAQASANRTSGRDYASLLDAVAGYIDLRVLFSPADCDPATWDPMQLQCLPPDDNAMATYYIPDWIDRALNVRVEGGEATDWVMGVVGSAVRF